MSRVQDNQPDQARGMVESSSGPPAAVWAGWLLAAAWLLASGGCAERDLPPAVVQQIEQFEAGAALDRSPGERSPSDRLAGDEASRFGRPQRVALRSVDEWTLEETAERALGRIGAAAVPHLRDQLRYVDSDPRRQAAVRRQAAEVLAQIGPDAQDAVPELTVALRDPSPEVRKSAAFALGQIGPSAASAVPELLQVMLRAQSPRRSPSASVPPVPADPPGP